MIEYPICTKCGYMLDATEENPIIIGLKPKVMPILHTSLFDNSVSFVYHRDICDGTKTVVLDLLKILLERGLMPEGTNWTP